MSVPTVNQLQPVKEEFGLPLTSQAHAARYSRGTVVEGTRVLDRAFEHCVIEDIGAKKVTFENCNFSYSVFLRAYFRDATFVKCKFVGCEFDRCNFRGAHFSECDFSYARFLQSHLEPKDLFNQLPTRPNVRREFSRTLRKNAESLGDAAAALSCFWYEMKQAELYLLEAAEAQEEYYKKKYPGFGNRVRFRIRLWSHRFSATFWGHGESPMLLLRSSTLLVLAFSILLTVRAQAFGGPPFLGDPSGAVGYGLKHTFLLMLGITIDGFSPKTAFATILFGIAAFMGFVVFGLFVTTLTRRYVKR